MSFWAEEVVEHADRMTADRPRSQLSVPDHAGTEAGMNSGTLRPQRPYIATAAVPPRISTAPATFHCKSAFSFSIR